MTLKANHQTAVFVRVHPDDSAAYKERVTGLAGSLNRNPNFSEGGTIKADFYSVNDVTGEVTPGVTFATAAPALDAALKAQVEAAGYKVVDERPAPRGRVSSPRLRAMAEEAGYRLSLVAEPNAAERVKPVEKPAQGGWYISAVIFEDDEDDFDEDDDYYDE